MRRPTKTLLIDAAETFFAEKGYRATSMEDISGKVGIRPSAIYKHFKNKKDLYHAVLDRMITPFFERLDQIDTNKKLSESIDTFFDYFQNNPTLAQFAVHATLSGGEHRAVLIERWYTPFWKKISKNTDSKDFIALMNMILGAISLTTLHTEGMKKDAEKIEQTPEQQKQLIKTFAKKVLNLPV